MFIVSKDGKLIINLDQVTAMYIGSDGCSIKCDYKNNGCQLGRYNSVQEAKKAIEIIAESIGKVDVCRMPNDNAVKAK